MSNKNILIFRIGHLGDTVIALPALWEIRRKFPAARLTLLTNIDFKNPDYISPFDVLPKSGLVDDFISYPTNLRKSESAIGLFRLWRQLRKGRFDFLVYLMPRIRTGRQIDRDLKFFRSAGISNIIGAEYIRKNALPMAIPRPTPLVKSESDFLLDLLESEGFEIDRQTQSTDLIISKIERRAAAEFLTSTGIRADQGLIAVAPGSKWSSKVWAEDRFVSVVARIVQEAGRVPIVFGGKEDRAAGNRLVDRWETGVNAAGRISVRESAAILEMCALYLGNDTGTMHIAAAVGTPCVGIFAAIDWKNRWTPFGDRNVVFRKTVDCEGCLTPLCPNNNLCLDLITEDEVFAACLRLLDT